jgi:hypothetical protein
MLEEHENRDTEPCPPPAFDDAAKGVIINAKAMAEAMQALLSGVGVKNTVRK